MVNVNSAQMGWTVQNETDKKLVTVLVGLFSLMEKRQLKNASKLAVVAIVFINVIILEQTWNKDLNFKLNHYNLLLV